MHSMSEEKIFSIQLKGALDGASSEDLLAYIESQLSAGFTRFLFNFSFVQFITSNGISTLIKIQNRMKQNPHLSYVFYGMTEEVENVLTLLGIYKKLPIRKSIVEAESYLRSFKVEIPKISTEPEKESSKAEKAHERIKFYYTGSPKEPVSKLEKISTLDKIETQIEPLEKKERGMETLEVPVMERLLEDKLSALRKEIKDTLSTELEKRLTTSTRSSAPATNEISPGIIPGYIQSKSKKNQEAPFLKIFPCEACGKRLRVARVGLHKCPNCNTEVYVNTSGPTRFIEKLDL